MSEKLEIVEVKLTREQWQFVVDTLSFYILKAQELRQIIQEAL